MSTGTSNKLQSSDFVHLHNHTHHSLLDGVTKIPALIERVKELGMEAVAITDHGTLSGAVEFYKAAKKEGIKPVIGIETYVAARDHTDKESQKDKANYHLILLAMNNKGYENLMRLSTIAALDGFYYRPRIDRKLLEKYGEGLIVLSGCIGSEVGDALRQGQYAMAKEIAEWYKNLFGDRYYFELQDHAHQWEEQARVNEDIKKLSKELEIKCVVTSDAHYLRKEDQEAHEILLCVQTGSLYDDENRMSLKDMDLFVADPKMMAKRWSHNLDYLRNTKEIADRCDVSIELDKILIPKFELPEGVKDYDQLKLETYQGLAVRYASKSDEEAGELKVEDIEKLLSQTIIERTEYELKVINKMGFASYFLIVSDFCQWGKNQGIVFGPGRGSAAGSIVSYALKITDLDPIAYDLLFERFLNPDRISMPDIDIDIQDSRRDEVIAYCVEKYSQERVAHIVTYGTMAARNAIRDVARVLDVPYAEADRLAKLVPPPIQGRHIPLAKSIKEDADLKAAYGESAQTKRVIDLAIKLEGTIRSHGVHAAGVVIAPEDIVKYTPLEMAQKGVVTTQYAMGPIEDLGLLKMDFLGLSNLTIIKNALRIIKKVYKNDIQLESLDLSDDKTFELLGKGDTTGVFQLESSGMKRYIKELKPDTLEDIIAMVALYRPGPLTAGLTDKFIARKNGIEPIKYEHESMKSALESTYGVLVYQEQVMMIAQSMSGFSGGQADTLRKAIGKKKRDVMAKLKKEFIEGARDNSGVSAEFAEGFWKSLEGFADYAFNKSHAACYGLIAYQTAYLKAHYPDAFMAALMTSDFDDSDRLAIEISECRHMGIEVLPPDINESFGEFGIVPEQQKIRFGLNAVKNVGVGIVESIVDERNKNEQYKSLDDFIIRTASLGVNRKVWESLAKAGAFDSLADRDDILMNLDGILAFAQKIHKNEQSGQTDLFGNDDSMQLNTFQLTPNPNKTDDREKLSWERELLGIYLSKHPLEDFSDYLEESAVEIAKITPEMNDKSTSVGGSIITNRTIVTKKGQKMAFIGIEDFSGQLEIIVFPDLFSEFESSLTNDSILLVTGKINTKDRDGRETEEIKILAEKIEILDLDAISNFKKTGNKLKIPTKSKSSKQSDGTAKALAFKKELYLHVEDPKNHDILVKLKKVLSDNPGDSDAILVLGTSTKSAVRLPFKIDLGNGLQDELKEILSDKAVVVKEKEA
jgi:DNA polymerase-3 subunit alpha